MRKRRLLFVTDRPEFSGPGTQLESLMQRLPTDKFDIHLVVVAKSEDCRKLRLTIRGSVHCLDPTSRKAHAICSLRNLIFSLNPDVIHAWGYNSHLPVILASLRHPAALKIASWFELPPNRMLLRRWIEEYSLQPPVSLTATHKSIAEHLSGQGFDHAIQIVPNGVASVKSDRDKAREKLLRLTGLTGKSVFLAGTVSQLSPRYRLKDLVWAIDLVCCIRKDVHLLIVGSGSGEEALVRFISKTESAANVHFLSPEKLQLEDLAGLDFYWNAQLEEPVPSVMLHVMSMEIPVISVVGAGTGELVLPLRSGLGTNYGARDEFARWTKYLIEQTDRSRQIARQGKRHVEKMFPIEQMIDGYLSLYSSTEQDGANKSA